jgi:hypothetical protein
MYRDGVGEGQLTFVYDTELKQILVSFYLFFFVHESGSVCLLS